MQFTVCRPHLAVLTTTQCC